MGRPANKPSPEDDSPCTVTPLLLLWTDKPVSQGPEPFGVKMACEGQRPAWSQAIGQGLPRGSPLGPDTATGVLIMTMEITASAGNPILGHGRSLGHVVSLDYRLL